MKKRCKYIYVIILFLTFISFKIDVYANKYLDGELVPDNYIINPKWEEYNNLSDEEKSSWEVIPEKYTYILDDGFVNYSNNGISLQGNIIASSIPSEFDLRNVNGKNYVSPPKYQLNLGLCWAFGSMSALESHFLMTHPLLSYYQDLDHDGIYEDASNVLTFSARQLDYATASSNYILEDIDSYYQYTHVLGAGAYFNSGVVPLLASGISPILDSVWGPYTLDLDPRSITEIYDINNVDYFVTETIDFPLNFNGASQDTINIIKQHVMNYGGVAFYGPAPHVACYNEEYHMVTNDGCESHEMTIIGWKDNYGPNNEGAWLIKNSWVSPNIDSSQPGILYYSMNLAFGYDGYVSSKEKDWDNNYDDYSHSTYTVDRSTSTPIYEVKYDRNSLYSEELKYINFYSYGTNSRFKIYVSNTGKPEDYVEITEVTKAVSGLLVVDIGDIILSDEAFSIKIVCLSGTLSTNVRNYVNAFTDIITETDDVLVEVVYDLDNPVLSSENSISVYANTLNLSIGEQLSLLKVYNSNNEDVTSLFSMSDGIVINNVAHAKITANESFPTDTFTFRIGYGNAYDEFSVELSVIEGIGIGGTGTESSPYIISTIEDLIKINTEDYYLSASYILNNDIDMSICREPDSICYNDGKGWLPIGYDSRHIFTGTFDGNNHTISNLYINKNTSYIGLFGRAKDAVFKNINIFNADVQGYSYTGILAGSITITSTTTRSTIISLNFLFLKFLFGFLMNFSNSFWSCFLGLPFILS